MAKPVLRKPKKKANPLKSAKIENIDYKDTATLRKFISDRGAPPREALPAPPPEGRPVAPGAVKNAREMALLPYSSSTR